MTDLEQIVALAWRGNPGALVHELNGMRTRIEATEGRKMTLGDLPKSARQFITAIYSVRRAPGRPRKADAQLLALRRAYERAALRFVFDQKRELLAFGRRSGMMEVIGGDVYPMSDLKPSDAALAEMEEETGLSEGAVRDLIYPDRRKPKATPK